MAGLGIFDTQLNSNWVQGMLGIYHDNFGHNDLPWQRRALMALPEAELEGGRVTALEFEDYLMPIIGRPIHGGSRTYAMDIGIRLGIIKRTDSKRSIKGVCNNRFFHQYDIIGHLERDERGELYPVIP